MEVRISAALAMVGVGVLGVMFCIEIVDHHQRNMLPVVCVCALGAAFLGWVAFNRRQ